MDIALLHLNSNSNSNSNSTSNDIENNNSNSNSNDIENNMNDNTLRIGNNDGNNRTLEDMIKEDRALVMFLMVLGLYIDDDRNSIGMKILARSWQCCLLVFGGIGFIWNTFIEGGYRISILNKTLSVPTSSSIDKFVASGYVLMMFVASFVQVTSLIYGVYNVYKRMIHRSVSAAIVSKHLASCKRTAVVYFICMALLVITIDPFTMIRSTYKDEVDDDYRNKTGQQTYPLYAFCQFTTNALLNLSVTCYLTVMLLFTSLSLMQIKTIQQHMIEMIDTNTLITDRYMDAKDEIMSLKNGSYLSAQQLTITAAINVVAFLFHMWLGSYRHISGTYTYGEMILFDFFAFPYLLKGYSCYYHYYYRYYYYYYH